MEDPRKLIVAHGYDALQQDYLEWASQIVDDPRERMLNELSARVELGARVLDPGCWAGLPSTKALAKRFVVTGADISEAQVQAARRNVPEATFIQGDLGALDFPPESFEGVTAFYAISHVPREEHASLFERVARWLVPGGLFLATLGASDTPDWVGDWLGKPMFFSSHDAEVDRRLLTAAGFELLVAEVIETLEPEGATAFLWVLARTRLA
jgi:cyclopropane fatty-acyl-phospholipid synthase-like methyltransferase